MKLSTPSRTNLSKPTADLSARRLVTWLGFASCLLAGCLLVSSAVVAAGGNESTAGYSPDSDPFADLAAAKQEAASSGRHILMEIGGEWCSWCHLLEDFLSEQSEVSALWDARFVTLKVNFSPENENKEFLSQYPEIAGYPHFFVLDAQGELLHSQNTGELEQGRGYSKTLMKAFIERWGPQGAATASTDAP